MYFSLSIKYEWKQRDSMQLFNFEYFYSEKRKTFDLIFFFFLNLFNYYFDELKLNRTVNAV